MQLLLKQRHTNKNTAEGGRRDSTAYAARTALKQLLSHAPGSGLLLSRKAWPPTKRAIDRLGRPAGWACVQE